MPSGNNYPPRARAGASRDEPARCSCPRPGRGASPRRAACRTGGEAPRVDDSTLNGEGLRCVWGRRTRHLLAVVALAGALAGCAREPAYSAGTPIPQPTPDRTVDAILRGLSQPAVAASPLPTILPAAATTGPAAPLAQRPTPATALRASDGGAPPATRPAAGAPTSPPLRAAATPTPTRPASRPTPPATSTPPGPPPQAPQRTVATPAIPTLPATPARPAPTVPRSR